MYVPRANAVDDVAEVVELVRRAGAGHLISQAAWAFDATMLPVLVDDELTAVRAHLARANRQWRSLDGRPALVIVTTADAYVSPNWYPTKADDPRVVPTWNYEAVHVHGTVRVHDDPSFVAAVVRELTDLHEAGRAADDGGRPWAVDDAPPEFVERQLRAIVGIELVVERVEARRKLSQNRPVSDRAGVVAGLSRSRAAGAGGVHAAMAGLADESPPGHVEA